MGFFDKWRQREGMHEHKRIEQREQELARRVKAVERIVAAHKEAARVERRSA
jgi:hypothetical protein